MDLLKEKIKESKYTQKKLAEKASISETHLSLILKGDRNLNYDIVRSIYNNLNYPSPINLILDYFGFNLKNTDYTINTDDEQIVDTVGMIMLEHLNKEKVKGNDKMAFIFSILSFLDYYKLYYENVKVALTDQDINPIKQVYQEEFLKMFSESLEEVFNEINF